jgi:hypothetical protein
LASLVGIEYVRAAYEFSAMGEFDGDAERLRAAKRIIAFSGDNATLTAWWVVGGAVIAQFIRSDRVDQGFENSDETATRDWHTRHSGDVVGRELGDRRRQRACDRYQERWWDRIEE